MSYPELWHCETELRLAGDEAVAPELVQALLTASASTLTLIDLSGQRSAAQRPAPYTVARSEFRTTHPCPPESHERSMVKVASVTFNR